MKFKADNKILRVREKENLVFDVGSPEVGNGAFVGVSREEGRAAAGEGIVDVLHDMTCDSQIGLPLWISTGTALHWVGAEEELALVLEILLDVVVAQALEVESKFHPGPERA